MNKKAVNILMENLVYILFVVVFVAIIFFSITRAGSQAVIFEQAYAKQIALIIDKAKPGIEVEIDTFEMQRITRKNKFNGNIVTIDNNENRVNVKLIDGKGYDYYFFSNNKVIWNLKEDESKLILKVIEPEKLR